MYYKLSIEDNSGKKIEITDPDVIQKVDVVLFQNDILASERSDQIYADVSISGAISDKSLNETKEIFNWSKTTVKSQNYRTISIQVYEAQDDKSVIRDFYFKEMYCFSYEEHFDNNRHGSFCLKLKQRKGEINTIVVE